MSRRKKLIRSIEKSISLPEDLVVRVDLELHSEVEGRVPLGSWQGLVTELLEEWYKGRMIGGGNGKAE